MRTLIKPLRILLLFVVFHQQVNSQLSNYSFSSTSGTYTPISGTTAAVSALSNGVTGLLPIGFSFTFNGISYTQFGGSTNGKIRLGAVLTAAEEEYGYSLSNHPERPLLAPLYDELKLSSASGLTYQTSGSAPNRILTVQWAQVYWPEYELAPEIEFQLKLYETNNRIEFIYRPLINGDFGGFAIIGMCAVATGSGNLLSLSDPGPNPSISYTSSTIIQTKPSLGRTYAFTPQVACTGQPVGGTTVSSHTSICSGINFSLSVTGATEADLGLGYQWQSSPDGISWTDIASATAKTLNTSQTSSTRYRRGTTCSGNSQYSTPVLVGLGTTGGPGPSITPSGAVSFCAGNSITLTSGAATGNQWYKNGTIISGAANADLVVNASGSYTVTATAGACTSDPSAAVVATAIASPEIPVIAPAGNTNMCQDGGMQFTIPSSPGISYQWFKDNSPISGANSNAYMATVAGAYTVRITNATNCSSISAASTLTIFPNPPAPVVTAGGPLTFCAGGSVQLTSSATGGSHQWINSTGFIIGANSPSYTATTSGVYSVRYTAPNGCESNSASTIVTVTAGPTKPVITANSNLLTSSSATNNQWLFNGSPIAGATAQTYTALASGNYTVQVTANGCTSTSDAYNFVATAIVDPSAWNNEISVFPNPVDDMLVVVNQGNRRLSLKLIDTNGRIVLEKSGAESTITLLLKKPSRGIYLLMITDIRKKETVVKTIVRK